MKQEIAKVHFSLTSHIALKRLRQLLFGESSFSRWILIISIFIRLVNLTDRNCLDIWLAFILHGVMNLVWQHVLTRQKMRVICIVNRSIKRSSAAISLSLGDINSNQFIYRDHIICDAILFLCAWNVILSPNCIQRFDIIYGNCIVIARGISNVWYFDVIYWISAEIDAMEKRRSVYRV